MRLTSLPSGETVSVLGQGTWHMGEDPARRQEEVSALRSGLDLGMSVIDTAEMYGDGAAESLVGQAIRGRRDEVFLVSKVLPSHASREGTIKACEDSLRRLKTDRLDLYLLHWRGSYPLSETVDGFEALIYQRKIRHWGVSNFDISDLEELESVPNGNAVTTDQVLYNLMRRGVEYGLLPWCRARSLPVMAYSPIEQGRLLKDAVMTRLANRLNATPAQVALAWVLRHDGIIALPKAGTPKHVIQNRLALDLQFSNEDLAAIDRAFPPPRGPRPLEMI